MWPSETNAKTGMSRVFVRGGAASAVQRSFDPSRTLDDAISCILDGVVSSGLSMSTIDGMVVGNMLGPRILNQQQIAALLANELGYEGPSVTVDAACGSGGAALLLGNTMVRSGQYRNVLVVGYEHMRHPNSDLVTQALAGASHWEHEGSRGETFVTLNGGLMGRYKRFHTHSDFASFALNAHTHASTNELALFRTPSTRTEYANSKSIHPHLRLMDASAVCNGSAAVVLSSEGILGQDVLITGSAGATDALHLKRRDEPLHIRAAEASTKEALRMSGLQHDAIDVLEPHDAYTVMGALSLESSGFVPSGQTPLYAEYGEFGCLGSRPCSTFGGLLRRGHPVGASGVYQAYEALQQLRGTAPTENRVPHAARAWIQSIGGAGTSVYTHILEL